MKTRKLTAAAMALVLSLALAAPAFAATFNLPTTPTWVNIVQQQGWATEGVVSNEISTDTIVAGLTTEIVQSATQLVVELNSPAVNDDHQIFVKTDAFGWKDGGNSTSYLSEDRLTLTFDLHTDPQLSFWVENVVEDKEVEWIAFGVQAWNEDWLDIKSVYLVYPDSVGAGGGDVPAAPATPAASGDNPTTGENTIIYVAGIALLAAAGALIVIRKRAKSN